MPFPSAVSPERDDELPFVKPLPPVDAVVVDPLALKPPARAPNAPPKPKMLPPLLLDCVLSSGIVPVEPGVVAGAVVDEEPEEKKDAGPDEVEGLDTRSAVYRGLSRVPTMTK